MKYEIFIGNKDRTQILQLPIIPPKIKRPSKAIANETFTTWWDGEYNFIEKPGLEEFSIDSWLPAKDKSYSFARSNVKAPEVISIIENARDNAEPITVVITGEGSFIVNDTYSIEAFTSEINKIGNTEYSLSCKRFRDYNTEIKKADVAAGWKQNATGWWYEYDSSENYYRDTWQQIDGYWYSFDFDGYARENKWLQDNGYWYWLKENSCQMARNEWVKIDGYFYYFGDEGGMYKNCYTPDGYWVDSSGKWVE